jgi:pyruvate dehydrogenase E2 component (dihydrolipoamide acetyltransferase)
VFDVDVEDPFEQPGPTQARRRALRVIACGRGCLLWRTGDDFTTQLCVRREHAMEVNLGMAVALEEGLVVPVIQGADRLTLEEIARQSRELADKAQNKKLLPRDYEGGTFTVSNLGMFGVDSFVAIINPPECAILAVGQIAPRVVPYGEGIAIRSLMTMTLSADHRIVDGVITARFLQELKRLLESPGF